MKTAMFVIGCFFVAANSFVAIGPARGEEARKGKDAVSGPADVEGWNRSRWGMNEGEILEAFAGQAILLEKPEHYESRYAPITIEAIEVGGDMFRVSFLLNSETKKLVQVNLQQKLEAKSHIAGTSLFGHIEEMLLRKYGQPSMRKDKGSEVKRLSRTVSIGGDIATRSIWNFPSTVVELSHNYIKDIYHVVIITYRENRKKELENL